MTQAKIPCTAHQEQNLWSDWFDVSGTEPSYDSALSGSMLAGRIRGLSAPLLAANVDKIYDPHE